MGQWDIEFAKRRRAAFEKAKEHQRFLVEQLELRARAAEAEAKLRKAEAEPATKEKASVGGKKQLKAEEAIRALYPNGRMLPSDKVLRGQVCKQLGLSEQELSIDTIARARRKNSKA